MIKKRSVFFIIGLILVVTIFNNIVIMIPYLFDQGGARMKYNIIEEITLDDLNHIINEYTNIKEDNIFIKIEENRLKIELPYITIKNGRALDKIISNKYENSIELIELTSYPPMEISNMSGSFILFFLAHCLFFSIGIYFIVKSISLTFKRKLTKPPYK